MYFVAAGDAYWERGVFEAQASQPCPAAHMERVTVNTISPSANAVMCQERLCMSIPIETVFPLKFILFLVILVAIGSSSFVMGF